MKTRFTDRILQHTRFPTGAVGRIMLRWMNRGHAPLFRWALSFLGWQPSWRVLDVGCGGGAALAQLLLCCPEGTVCGVDPSPESVACTRRTLQNAGDRASVVQGTAESLPCASEKFDAVTAFETLYFWENLPRAFSEVGRVLRPGGYFLICCEAGDPSDDRWVQWARRIEGMRLYSAEELGRLLADAGFTGVVVHRHPRGPVCLVARKPR